MTRPDRARYEMFQRVRQFAGTYGGKVGKATLGGKAFSTVVAAVEQIETCSTALVRTSDDGATARDAARKAIARHLKDVARTARLASRKLPAEGGQAFEVPRRRPSDVSLLAAARGVIADGPAAAPALAQFGLAGSFIRDLQALVDQFGEADRGRLARRLSLASARVGLTTALADAADAVHTLDVVVANTFKDDPMALAEWQTARRWKTRRSTAAS